MLCRFRWGHSGFKELYKNELGLKSRRSRSRDKMATHRSRSRSRSRDRSFQSQQFREKDRELGGHRSRLRSGSRERMSNTAKWDSSKNVGGNRNRKRSLSSSDRSLTGSGGANRRPSKVVSDRNRESEQRWAQKPGKNLSRGDSKSSKSSKGNVDRRITGHGSLKVKSEELRRDSSFKREWSEGKKRSVPRSGSASPAHRRSLSRLSDRGSTSKKRPMIVSSKRKRGPISPPERSPFSRSSGSPPMRSRRSANYSGRSSDSRSSSSRSRTSRSHSSSSSSDYSSSSHSSQPSRDHVSAIKAPSAHIPIRNKTKPGERSMASAKKEPTITALSSKAAGHGHRQSAASAKSVLDRNHHSHSKTAHDQPANSDSESSSNASSSESEDMEEGEDDGEERDADSRLVSSMSEQPVRVSLSERFGKLAQLSSQRRNLELVQLRIVAPIGASHMEKNISVDESSAAPVITKLNEERSHSIDSLPIVRLTHSPENMMHHPEERERPRDDRWKDWHER